MVLNGRPHERLLKLHEKYGQTIRIAPNELSFIDPDAWFEVMNHLSSEDGSTENNKDPHYVDPRTGSMISVSKADHARMRTILNTAFSPQAMHKQLPRIMENVEHLLECLERRCENGKTTVNLVQWYQFVLFDIISDLTLGEPFGCLASGKSHPWVAFVFARANLGAYVRTLLRLPGTEALLRLIVPKKVMIEAEEHLAQTRTMVTRRLGREVSHPDFVGAMINGKDNLLRADNKQAMRLELDGFPQLTRAKYL